MNSYPALRILLFFIAGLLLPFSVFYVLFGITLAVLIFTFILKKNWLKSIGIWCFSVFLGVFANFVQEKFKGDFHLQENVSSYLVEINNSPENKPKSYKAKAKVSKANIDGKWIESGGEVLLYFNLDAGIVPEYGDVFLIYGAPREIEGPKNPEEFNYKKFQEKKGVYSHHFLRKGDFEKLGNTGGYFIFRIAYQLNDYAKEIFKEKISNEDNFAIANAMIIGQKDDLSVELRNSFATAGAVHILAVSGLHVGILFLLLTYIFGWINKFKNGKIYFGMLIICMLWIYALFTGLSPSVSRATLMFTAFQIGLMMNRPKNSINIIAISAIVLLLINPSWIYDVGFQLSYLAILGIVYLFPYLNAFYQPRNYFLKNLWQITAVSLCAQLFTFPLSIYYFHQFPSYFLLTNPIVTVLSTIILFAGIALLFLGKIPFIGAGVAYLFDWSLTFLNIAVKWIETLPQSKLEGFSISNIEVVLLYLLILALVWFKIKKHPNYFKIATAVFAILCCLSIYKGFEQRETKTITFHFIPKSSGLSLISSQNAQFFATEETINDPRVYGFHLKNFYDKQGISQLEKIVPPEELPLSMSFGKRKLLWIQNRERGRVNDDFEWVLISNNSVYSLEKTFTKIPKTVILDDSNSIYAIDRLQKEAKKLHVKLISLYETGAVTYNLN